MKCPQCERFFATADAIVAHRIRVHHNIPRPCKCKVCGDVFQTWKERRKHTEVMHERRCHWQEAETKPILPVSELWRDFPEQESTASPPDESTQIECSAVSEGNTPSFGIVRGKITGRSGIPRAQCDECKGWFTSRSALRNHRRDTGHSTGLKAKINSLHDFFIQLHNGEQDATEASLHSLHRPD